MIRLRRGRMPCCRQISLLVCLVMMLGLFLSYSPQPAAADSTTLVLATYLQSLYSQLEATNTASSIADLATLKQIYNNAVSLAVYSPSDPGALPWATVFAPGNLDLSTLAATGYGGNEDQAAIAVSTLLRDYAEMIYYGSQGTYTANVIDSFWNEDNNAQTISNIVGSTVTEDAFSNYMLASMQAIPAAVKSLLPTETSVEQSTILYNLIGGDLADPGTNYFLQECIASALDGTATGSYAQFGANSGGANWSFGSDVINKGYRFVDGAISTINGVESAGEIILVKYMPLSNPATTITGGGGGGGGGVSPAVVYPAVPPPAPPVVNPSPDTMIARWPGSIPLTTQGTWYSTTGSVYADFTEAAPTDQATLAAAEAKGLEERVYYFNEQYQKWVALASYPQADGSVLVKNDGGYNNVWMEMYAVRQPDYTDIAGSWAQDVINRMNGLALIEGYPIIGDPNTLQRTAGPDRDITRAEFTTILARALGDLPTAEHKLYGILNPSDQQSVAIIAGMQGVPVWSQDFVAGAIYSGLASGVSPNDFAGNEPITRIEAAIMVSNMLKRLPNYQPADLSQFADAADVPDWAKAGVADGVLSGYPNNTLLPNNPITRAEALVTILKMLRALGW